MKIGVPSEIKPDEYRVGLTSGGVREYVAAGHRVVVQAGAGHGIGATDADYEAAGAAVAADAVTVFAGAEMIVKVKEPQPSEWVQLRERQVLFIYLHLAPDPDQTHGLLGSGCTLVDVAIDQGGCFETGHATTHADPTYEVDGVIHYCVANMPGSVPLTSSHALVNATLPCGLAIARDGLGALAKDPGLLGGLNVIGGKLVNRAVGESLGIAWSDPAAAIAA